MTFHDRVWGVIGCLLLMVLAPACSSKDAPTPAPTKVVAQGFGTCSDAPPAGAPEAPDPPMYSGDSGVCPIVAGQNRNHIMSSGVDREFLVVVPEDMKTNKKLPLVFLWHWVGGTAEQFYAIANAQSAVNAERFIAVIPEGIGSFPSVWRGWFTGDPPEDETAEFRFFDDMLACVSAQFGVNKNCVSTAGVSDGALWSSQLIGGRGQYLSSAIILSGGVQSATDDSTKLIRPYIPASHAMPVVALWGGDRDICVVLNFQPATKALEDALAQEKHFVIECEHDCGHSVPPLPVQDGGTLLDVMWKFVKDHPYWLPPGTSPYQKTGLPDGWPDWCSIGVGNATQRMGGGCGKLGCDIVTGQ